MMRDYSRAFHCSVAEVMRWKVYAFLDEYVEALQQIKEENEEQERRIKQARRSSRRR